MIKCLSFSNPPIFFCRKENGWSPKETVGGFRSPPNPFKRRNEGLCPSLDSPRSGIASRFIPHPLAPPQGEGALRSDSRFSVTTIKPSASLINGSPRKTTMTRSGRKELRSDSRFLSYNNKAIGFIVVTLHKFNVLM